MFCIVLHLCAINKIIQLALSEGRLLAAGAVLLSQDEPAELSTADILYNFTAELPVKLFTTEF